MTKTRAIIYSAKPKFLQKAIQFNLKIPDGLDENYTSQISIFIPKLTRMYTTPCIMLNVANGRGSTLIRCKNPNELINALESLISILRSDIWLDIFDRMNRIGLHVDLTKQLTTLDDKIFDYR